MNQPNERKSIVLTLKYSEMLVSKFITKVKERIVGSVLFLLVLNC